MSNIDIDKSVLDKTPKELTNLLKDEQYLVTKIKKLHNQGMVDVGHFKRGYLSVVDRDGRPALQVTHKFGYLRTSPIVEILDASESVILVRTEGGVYKIELEKNNEA